MKTRGYKSGFTLVEMVVVVAVIVLLVSMVVGVARHIDAQGKERLCRDTIALLGNALEQFHDFGYEYRDNYADRGLVFPLDCNDDSSAAARRDALVSTIKDSLEVMTVTIEPVNPARPIVHQYEYSGSEGLYFFLSQVPDCRKTLDKIDRSLLTNKDNNGNEMKLVINTPAGPSFPLVRIIDPWKVPLRYDYYDDSLSPLPPNPATRKTFPLITSAGPDGLFDTSDDISNVKAK